MSKSRLGSQLLRANHKTLNLDEVRSYFQLFEREAQLDELLQEIG